MKRIFTAIIIFMACLYTSAQTTRIKVQYEATTPKINIPGEMKTSGMTLIAGTEGSLYFNEMSMYCDSLTSTPEGKRKLQEMQLAAWMTQGADGSITIDKTKGNAPEKRVNLYIVKDLHSGTERVYDKWANEYGYYDEPLSEISWQTGDSTAVVLGYECIMAETDYHGRHWTAWFAPDIPLQDGPWKLCGLPGMILAAESGPAFRFEAKGIELTEAAIPLVLQTENYEPVERRKALADDEYYYNNRESILQARFGGNVKFETNNDIPKFDAATHALEPDYK